MSEINTKTDAISKNNELILMNAREETVSENLWIIRDSKTHPGLKYYFNTVTGVSLWNISREDMERAKQTMKGNRNQPSYINCPEPNDLPPLKRISTSVPPQVCEQTFREPKNLDRQLLNSGLAGEEPGFRCDICYGSVNSSPNIITVNLRACPHLEYSSILDNAYSAGPQSQTQPSSELDTSTLENSHYNKGQNHVTACKKSPNRSISENMGHNSSNENLHNQSSINTNLFNHNTNHLETLDLAALKMFAKNGVNNDKWYIIADADVYLHHITLLKAVVSSDKQCCLMVPQNVKVELEKATKTTELRTKAFFASYYIYNMFDSGIARIDEGDSHNVQDKTNEEHVLDCCSKLKEENFYVIVITNDIELQKYRNKIFIPIFTVTELKEYIYKSSSSVTTKSPEPALNLSQSSKNIKVSTSNHGHKIPDEHELIITNPGVSVKPNQNVQTSFEVKDNDKATQAQEFCNASKITADAEVQTNFHQTQLEERELISSSQSCEPTQHTSISGPSKRIKLRRRKLDEKCEIHSNVNDTIKISPNINELNVEQLEKPYMEIFTNENLKTYKHTTIDNFTENFTENYTISKQALSPNRETILQSPRGSIEPKNVMFEVTSEVMEQSLKRRSDEWVSRFVQIMEEALTQVLRKNSLLYLPPPWNMYEAAICIERRYNTDEDVADASKKFLNILNQLCNEKGTINANITPSQYMEMYSFGVYVIDALQGIFSTCEDLQSAAESLSKLLNDIQDSESELTNLEEHLIDIENVDDNVEVLMIVETESLSNDGLMDNTEYLPNITETAIIEDIVPDDSIERHRDGTTFKITFNNTKLSNSGVTNDRYTFNKHIRFKIKNAKCNDKYQGENDVRTENMNTCNTSLTSSSGYNLRSKRKTMTSENQGQQSFSKDSLDVLKNKRFKSTFLSNLLLQKNKKKENAYGRPDITTEDIPDEVDSAGNVNSNKGCSYKFSSPTPELSHKINTNSNEPKVIRNFVMCSEFEDRLRTRRVHDEMEELDFEDEKMETGNMEDEVSSGGTGRLQIDEFRYRDNVDVDPHIEQEITKPPQYINIDLKCFMKMIAQEIKKLSIEVYNFSKNACESLNSMSVSKEIGSIREKAEELHFYVDKVCTALTNILNRDEHGRYNVQALFKRTEFDDISVDEKQMEVYGSFITRCLEQAQDLNNTIKDIMSAVCEH